MFVSSGKSSIDIAVVLGGNGAMGSLFCEKLLPQVNEVIAIDLKRNREHKSENIQFIQSDAANLNTQSKAAVANADLIIIALPEAITLLAWKELVAIQKTNSLLVDTLSVKTPLMRIISESELLSEIISINPMFAPSLGFSGQSTVVIEVNRGPIANSFLAMFECWNCHLVYMTAEEHDRYAAMFQTITHAAILSFGMSLKKMGYDLTAAESMMPPPHRSMIALVARILSADPEVYWDIQSSNPYAEKARHMLNLSLKELSQNIDAGNQDGFNDYLKTLRDLVGQDHVEKYNQTCASMFRKLRNIE